MPLLPTRQSLLETKPPVPPEPTVIEIFNPGETLIGVFETITRPAPPPPPQAPNPAPPPPPTTNNSKEITPAGIVKVQFASTVVNV